ncbi:DUF3558 domain-containing protein [Nocardia implantans]|uniref:DUF3558 domain-containing protein n=1 Tax=Nocardia implantans TaxID=3108168 RepID=A0ABU6ANL2_9NOCA|nr:MULTISPECIES: DUF3558 domain-containing protein [unclassified Nocardia]MBF6192196.1 DUF3558 domain-containing protein [Nocardia beijingensis]MEA3530947.1 DUF3558 domain-containing protein [Nocardia sp. CDC192]MEB3509037.1 DUF3558 domain-containing protein [Nocardia sp. CDC186]
MKRVLTTGFALIAMVTSLAACSADNSDDTTTSRLPSTSVHPTPSMAASVPPAPAQPDSKKLVRFDPCFEVSDDLVAEAGFDPATRQRSSGEIVTDLLTAVGCSFRRIAVIDGQKTITGNVTVHSTNSPLDQIKSTDKYAVFNTDAVNGRAAALYTVAALPGSCYAAISSADGTLEVSLTAIPGAAPVPAACDQIREVATIFATALGGK